ncbi:hybrid sensor histidine kinase/response regulator [Halorussus salinisoli]|uniref:hybrid sensor histidine kinase/response regulator n=1 Tax=Halorussus salinisoli TaxID=2558242 RepID=UPI0010C1B77D|nr:ATP-binding protein [Halorussus salinisoli]
METAGEAVRVLYVGDRRGTGDFAEYVGDEDAFTVTRVDDAATALDRLESETFDCVVGDVADGFGLLDAVRDRWPDLPYVFVASEGDDVASEALERGATDYLQRRGDCDQRALFVTRVESAVVRRTADGLVGTLVTQESADDDYARIATELRENETYLRKLYRIASNTELSYEQKRRRLLELGRERLDVDVGFVSHIEGDTFEIVDAVGSHELLQPDRTAPLAETYCRKTTEDEGLLSVEDAESEGWLGDPAYETYGLGCYVGAKIFVNDALYGTLCFADRDPRDRSFSENEKIYVELISQWLRYEYEQIADERALREQNRRLEEFASVVSHDLRNPLNVARIYLSMAEDSGSEEDFEQVRCAHDRMEQLIQNLLMLARQGDALAGVTDHDLSAVVAETWENVETDDATCQVEDGVTVEADRERLQQLLENLFRNSIDHGGEAVTIRVGPLDGVDGFYVEDDGPGVPEDQRESVFEHGYSTVDGGTGLGLAIVRRIADAHDWTVSVGESDSGGARFEVEF